MSHEDESTTPYRSSHLLVLASYSLLALGLMGETLLMGWELWAVPIILACVALCWLVHIRQRIPERQRLWIYTTLMMGTFFFYGIHVTSTYDMSPLMIIEILIFTTTGESALVIFCLATYYLTLGYDLVAMALAGTEWTSLLVSRTILHVVLMFMAGWLARFIIRQWAQLFDQSDGRIQSLSEASRRMGVFMANLSHELRTPVNAILGTTGMMLEQQRPAPDEKDLCTVRDAGQRLAEQIGDILDFSELENHHLVVHHEPYTLFSLLNDLTAELRPKVPAGIELVIDVEADVPAGLVSDVGKLRKILFHLIGNSLRYTREGGVYVHVMALRRPYGINLCVEVTDTGIGMTQDELEHVYDRFYQAESGRAVRTGGLGLGIPITSGFVSALGGFMVMESEPDVGTTVRVSIPQEVADDRPCMQVENRDGLCLGSYLNMAKYASPQVREYYNHMIYDLVSGLGTPMHRVTNVDDLKELVQRVDLTHLFVGEAEYESAPEYLETLARRMVVVLVASEGFDLPASSHVTVMPKPFYCFPVASILNAPTGAAFEEQGRPSYAGVRALVVDDEPMNLTVASAILGRYGMRVTCAESGIEAMRLCEGREFDIVFMDHMMPQMDGIEAMHHVRRIMESAGREVPIVALTANALSTARQRFLAEGFDGFIAKPIETPELERVLRRVLPAGAVGGKGGATSPSPDEGAATEPHLPKSGEAAPFSSLVAAGVSVQTGLGYCQGDEGLYGALLAQFAHDAPGRRRRLAAFVERGDLAGYAIEVHALKSASLTLGARELSSLARELEDAARAGDDALVRSRHDALVRLHDALAAACEEAVRDGATAPLPREETAALSPDDEVLEFLPEEVG